MAPRNTDDAPDFSTPRISPQFLKMLPTDADRDAAIALDRIDQQREWQMRETLSTRSELDEIRIELAEIHKRFAETVTVKAEFTTKRNALILSTLSSVTALIIAALTAWFASNK